MATNKKAEEEEKLITENEVPVNEYIDFSNFPDIEDKNLNRIYSEEKIGDDVSSINSVKITPTDLYSKLSENNKEVNSSEVEYIKGIDENGVPVKIIKSKVQEDLVDIEKNGSFPRIHSNGDTEEYEVMNELSDQDSLLLTYNKNNGLKWKSLPTNAWVMSAIRYTISLQKNMENAGTINFTGEKKFLKGSTVELISTVNDRYSFLGWFIKSIDSSRPDQPISEDSVYSFKATKDLDIIARFDKGRYNISFVNLDSTKGSISITINEEDPFIYTTAFQVYDGSNVKFTANANDGYYFSSFNIGGQNVTNDYTISDIRKSYTENTVTFKEYSKIKVVFDEDNFNEVKLGDTVVSNGEVVNIEDNTNVNFSYTLKDDYVLLSSYLDDNKLSEKNFTAYSGEHTLTLNSIYNVEYFTFNWDETFINSVTVKTTSKTYTPTNGVSIKLELSDLPFTLSVSTKSDAVVTNNTDQYIDGKTTYNITAEWKTISVQVDKDSNSALYLSDIIYISGNNNRVSYTFKNSSEILKVKQNSDIILNPSKQGEIDYTKYYHNYLLDDGSNNTKYELTTSSITYSLGTSNKTFSVNSIKHTITYSSSSEGYIWLGDTEKDETGPLTFEALKDETYTFNTKINSDKTTSHYFSSWQLDNNLLNNTNSSYTLTVTGNNYVKAVYGEKNKYSVKICSNDFNYGYITVNNTDYKSAAYQNDIIYNGVVISVSATSTNTDGYKFKGWSNDGGTTIIDSNSSTSFTITNSITYTAVFEAISYTVTAISSNTSKGSVSGGGSYDYGSTATISASGETGYYFNSWSGDYTGSDNPYSFTVYGNSSYSASFTPNETKVYLDGTYYITIVYGETALSKVTSIPSETGHTFSGYYTGSEGTGTQIIDEDGNWKITNTSYSSTSEVHLYSYQVPNTYTVTFDKNGGTNSPSPSSKTVTYGSTYGELSNCEGYTSEGVYYCLSGWYTDSNCTDGNEITSSTKVEITSDQTLYAKWIEGKKYTIYFSNGEHGSDGQVSYSFYESELENSLSSVKTPTANDGYTFIGYYDTNNSPIVDKDGNWNSSYTINKNVIEYNTKTLTAEYSTNSYTLTIDYNYTNDNGNAVISTYNVSYGANLSNYKPSPAPTRTGYTFQNWDHPFIGTMPASPLTITASWEPNKYTVVFDGNGATSGEMDDQEFTYDDLPQTLPENKFIREYSVEYEYDGGTVDKEGDSKSTYTFDGWDWDRDEKVDFTDKVTFNLTATSGGTATLYALWTSYPISLPEVSKTGYDFNGWSNSNGTKIGSKEVSFTPTLNCTLTAQWTQNTVTITYYVNKDNNGGGTDTYPQKVEMNVSSTLDPFSNMGFSSTLSYTITYDANGGTVSPESEKIGYVFSNWNTSYNGKGTSYSDKQSSIKISNNLDLYAIWVAPETTEFPEPTRDYYTFLNWYDSETGGNIVTSVNSTTTIYAHWKGNPITVSFNLNYDESISNPDDITVYYGETYGSGSSSFPSDITRENYYFKGWYTSDGTKIDSTTIVTTTEKTQILYAKWTAMTFVAYYTVTDSITVYNNSYGASLTGISDAEEDTGGDIVSPDDSIDSGNGDTLNSDIIESHKLTYTINDIKENTTEDTGTIVSYNSSTCTFSIKALSGWGSSFTVTNSSYSVSETIDIYSKESGKEPTVYSSSNSVLSLPTSLLDGTTTYTYGTISVGEGSNFDITELVLSSSSSNTTQSYTITYNANGGTGTVSSDTYTGTTTIKSGSSLSRDGYTFTGWNTQSNGNGTNYVVGKSVSGKSLNLYAVWEADITDVTVYYTATQYVRVYEGDTVEGGYTDGYYTIYTLTSYNLGSGKIDISNANSLSIDASDNYTNFSFSKSKLSGEGTSINISSNSSESYDPGDLLPKQSGDRTLTDSSGTYTVTSLELDGSLIDGGTTTYYRLYYDLNGGSGTTPTDTTYYESGKSATVTSETFTRTYYTFNGWNTKSDGSGTYCKSGGSITINSNTTLYAVWVVKMDHINLSPEVDNDEGAIVVYSTDTSFVLKATPYVTSDDTLVPENGYFDIDYFSGSSTYSSYFTVGDPFLTTSDDGLDHFTVGFPITPNSSLTLASTATANILYNDGVNTPVTASCIIKIKVKYTPSSNWVTLYDGEDVELSSTKTSVMIAQKNIPNDETSTGQPNYIYIGYSTSELTGTISDDDLDNSTNSSSLSVATEGTYYIYYKVEKGSTLYESTNGWIYRGSVIVTKAKEKSTSVSVTSNVTTEDFKVTHLDGTSETFIGSFSAVEGDVISFVLPVGYSKTTVSANGCEITKSIAGSSTIVIDEITAYTGETCSLEINFIKSSDTISPTSE